MLAEKQSGNAVANDLPEVRGKNLEYRFTVANNYILRGMNCGIINRSDYYNFAGSYYTIWTYTHCT